MLTWNRWLILFLSIPYVLSFHVVNIVFALPETKVMSVEYAVEEPHEKIVLFFNSPPEYITTTLENPDRIVIDLQNCFLPETHLVRTVNGRLIKSCRISQNSKNKTRVVLDVRRRAEYDIVSSPASDTTKHTITVQVTYRTSSNNRTTLQDKTTPQTFSKKLPMVQVSPQSSRSNTSTEQQITPKAQDPQAVISDPDMADNIFIAVSSKEPLPWETEENRDKTSSVSMSGSLMTRFHTDTVHNNRADRNANEQTQGAINRFTISTAYKDFVTLSARSDYRYAGDRDRYENHDLDLYEAYIKYSRDPFSLKVGKQIRRWGKADQLSPVDTLNPEDTREFITMEYEDRKIPLWMADATLQLDTFSVEAVYIPFFEPSKMDYFGTDWAVYSHLKEDIQTNAAIPDTLKSYFQQMGIDSTNPDDNGLNGEYGLRVSTTLNGWDIGATYHYAWEDQPFFTSFPVKNINLSGSLTETDLMSTIGSAIFTQEMVEATYVRSNITGIEFETIISDFGVRGEAAWHDSQPFIKSNLVSTERPVFYGIIGADYTGRSNWYANLQLSYTHISGYETSILYFKQDTVALLGELNKELFSSWVKLSMHYYITLNENQFYLSPRIEYSYIPNLDIIFGAHIFEGSPYAFMGRFDDNDQIFLDMKYHF